MAAQSDRIEKTVMLKAPLERVWRAVSDSSRFGAWFGMELDGPFAAGARLDARIRPTRVDPDVAKMQAPHEGMPFEIVVERVEPMRLLSFRWHPYAVDSARDYSNEAQTLVSFELEEVAGGTRPTTRLTITESGFDRIPLARRAEAFKANEHGWAVQATLIEKYLAQTGA